MITRHIPKLVTAAVMCTAALFLGSGLPASASTGRPQIPQAATGCADEVCMHITTPSNGRVTVNAWVRDTGFSFYGHYDLSYPGTLLHSPTGNWTHNGSYYWRNQPAIAGVWCVTGWRNNGGGNFTNVGKPCETVS